MPNTPSRRRTLGGPLTIGAVVAMLGTLLVAAPVAAAPSTVPTASSPYGATFRCMTKSIVISGHNGMRLKRIKIAPPTSLFAHQSSQVVGWRFLVQRRSDAGNWYGKWTRVLASTTQKATATLDQAAVFSAASAAIGKVDSIDSWPDGKHTVFRLVLHFYWYADDGSMQTEELYKGGEYAVYRDGVYQLQEYGNCEGAWLDS